MNRSDRSPAIGCFIVGPLLGAALWALIVLLFVTL